MSFLLLYILIGIPYAINAQTFGGKNGIITDLQGSRVIPSFYEIPVDLDTNTIGSSFGLEKVCIHIRHRRPSDLKIELLAPDGTKVWLSNRNGLDNDYGYRNTCLRQGGFDGPIHEARFNFDGEYSTEGRLDFINNGQNPNGVWLLLISDLKEGVVGKLESVDITFGDNPAYLNPSPCSSDNVDDCYTNREDGKMLPDLIISESLSQENIFYFDQKHKSYPNQLRFAAAMANIGHGPLEIVTTANWYCGSEIVDEDTTCANGSSPTNNVQQIIYQKGNKNIEYDTLKSGVMFYDDSPGHNHYHVQNWASFKLLKKRWWTKNPKYWKVIASSNKVSYCLFDNKICTKENEYCQDNNRLYEQSTLPNYGLGKYTACNSRRQGISVGGIDYYGMNYEGQSIEVPSDIKSGQYYLFIEVDPNNEYKESNEDNNSILIPINLSATTLTQSKH